MGIKYINEFIYFDMVAGINRLKAEESILNGYSDIEKLKEITETTIFEQSDDIDMIIDSRLDAMKCGTGQCIKLEKLDEVYTEPHIELLDENKQGILSKQNLRLVGDILSYKGSNDAIALDINYQPIKMGSKNAVEQYIKERMLGEKYISNYYMIASNKVYKLTPTIVTKARSKFALKQGLFRYILFGIIAE